MSLIYRTASEKDVAILQDLGMAAYGRLKNQMTPANWEKMRGSITSKENIPKLITIGFGFVCEKNHHIVGMAFLVPSGNPNQTYSKKTSYIRMVGVHPDAGGKGIAQNLTRLCLEKAKALGEKTISLHSAQVMYAARYIYEKLGFQPIRPLDAH